VTSAQAIVRLMIRSTRTADSAGSHPDGVGGSRLSTASVERGRLGGTVGQAGDRNTTTRRIAATNHLSCSRPHRATSVANHDGRQPQDERLIRASCRAAHRSKTQPRDAADPERVVGEALPIGPGRTRTSALPTMTGLHRKQPIASEARATAHRERRGRGGRRR
jgi:hypothetical protein